ncbi:MAG TPA: YciI family protein [Mycobacterium sp.]|nr:YciI family protein [Mycobacterium sp.]
MLTITYLQPPEVIAEARPAHLEWVKAHVDDGTLILAGRLGSGTGGILIAGETSTEAADELTATDPYVLAGVVSYDRTSLEATLRSRALTC